MRFCIVVGVCLVTAIGSTAFAQTTPSFEASVGYSWLHQRPRAAAPSFDRHGWVASAAGNVNSWFGVKGEVGGDYSDRIHQDVHSFLGGAQFTVRRNSRVTPWAHFLVGVVRTGEGGGLANPESLFSVLLPDGSVVPRGTPIFLPETRSDFAIQPGFGFDFSLRSNFGLRFGADYRRRSGPGTVDRDSVRLQAGIVFRLGEK
jgi:hypothetical protein